MIVVWALLGLLSWALLLGWLVSPWLELAVLLFWTAFAFYTLERGPRRRR